MLRRTSLLLMVVAALTFGLAAPALAGSDDQTIADDVVLTEGDVADYGLEEFEVEEDPPPSGSVCKKVRAAIEAADEEPHAVTAFASSSAFLEDRAIVYPSVKAARAPLKAYASRQGARCFEAELESGLEDLLQESFGEGSNADYEWERIDVPLGDEGFAYQALSTITDADGNVSELALELGLIRVGRGVVVLQVQSQDEIFPGSEDLATVLTDRLEEGLASA